MLRHPCILGDPQRQAQGAKNVQWSQTKGKKLRIGCLTPAFSGAQKRAEMLCRPCILGDPQHQARGAKNQKWSHTEGNKIRRGYLTPAFSGYQNGQKCYVTPALSGIPNAKRGEQKFSCGPKQRGTK